MSERRALISVSDKRDVEALARGLVDLGFAILSTGGTAERLRQAGVAVTEVAAHTGAPEILDGRVKTLHPRIHAGLLARPTAEHRAELAQHGIPEIDVLVVNLYPFAATIAKPGVTFDDAIENIDIGGPSMIRGAAKNFERVAVVVDPGDYGALVEELRAHGAVSRDTRFRLARKAFAHTAAYDATIARWLDGQAGETGFPPSFVAAFVDGQALRYGENPHQRAAFYRAPVRPARPSVAFAEVLQGKELSYNNILDCDAALDLVLDLGDAPAAAIIKHTNPCGAAVDAAGVLAAYERARACDPTSAFGGIVAVNRAVDEALARKLAETFLECVVAPGFDEAARGILSAKKNLRLLAYAPGSATGEAAPALRSVGGGLLVQDADRSVERAADAKVVTKRRPTDDELRALDFAWRVAKNVKSNAIVFARIVDGAAITVGIGAGQMSRIDSTRIAVEKAQTPVAGCVVASDAFFPFRDGLDALAQAGATAVIQPGGSVRDAEVIAAADEQGIAMVFTGHRHFRH